VSLSPSGGRERRISAVRHRCSAVHGITIATGCSVWVHSVRFSHLSPTFVIPMKLSLPSFCRQTAIALLVTASLLAATTGLHAQSVFLTFSGGNGVSPVTVSWSTPINYTLDTSSPNFGVAPYFVSQSIPNGQLAFPVAGGVAAVAPTYSGTGTGSSDGLQTINQLYGVTVADAQNDVFHNDVVFRSSNDNDATILTSGDTIMLSIGSMVYAAPSNGSYSGTLPTSGFYNTIVVDAAYEMVGTGSAVPEPSTYTLIAGVAMLGFVTCRRRKYAV